MATGLGDLRAWTKIRFTILIKETTLRKELFPFNCLKNEFGNDQVKMVKINSQGYLNLIIEFEPENYQWTSSKLKS